jgi:hypothetical protein
MRIPPSIRSAILTMVALSLLMPAAAHADLSEAEQTMLDLEKAARHKSLALLVVLKNMDPEISEGQATVSMARIIATDCEVRETRDPASRLIQMANLNDEYVVLEKDDDRVHLDLGQRRTGWVNETQVQLFEVQEPRNQVDFKGVEDQLLRRYASVTDELLAGLNEDRERADALLAQNQGRPGYEELEGLHRKVVELHTQAIYFHEKYIESYDFSMANRKRFLDNLSAWGEFLLGKSSFSTTTLISADTDQEDKVEDTLFQLSLGGDLEINEKNKVRASFARKKEVNQTPYATTGANVGLNHQLNPDTNLDVFLDTYSYADEINEFNDFRRNIMQLKGLFDRTSGKYLLNYTFTGQSYSEHEDDDYSSHGLRAGADWDRGAGSRLRLRLDSRFQSSDADIHKFSHVTPSLELIGKSGKSRSRLKGLFEFLSYDEASARSFQRAHLVWEKSRQDGVKRKSTAFSATHKHFPENDLSTYLQVKAVWKSSRIGPRSRRSSLSTYTNFHLNNSDNNFTDLRLGRATGKGDFFSDLNAYSRIWHKPGDVDEPGGAKPYVLDVFGRFGWQRGPWRFGPTVGLHLVAEMGAEEVWKQDGNLVRVGAAVDGRFSFRNNIQLIVNASYDYGFVYSDQIAVDPLNGDILIGDVVQRHPTTLQISAFASAPINKNFDLTGRLMVYRIDTDMTRETSLTPVTDNDRFSLFVGVRYHHN